jgi:hypothetical protein
MPDYSIVDYNEALERICRAAKDHKRKLEKGGYAGYRYIFLIGAGASISSGIPGGDRISEQLKDEYEITDKAIEDEKSKDGTITKYQAILRLAGEETDSNFISEYIRTLIYKA